MTNQSKHPYLKRLNRAIEITGRHGDATMGSRYLVPLVIVMTVVIDLGAPILIGYLASVGELAWVDGWFLTAMAFAPLAGTVIFGTVWLLATRD